VLLYITKKQYVTFTSLFSKMIIAKILWARIGILND